MVNTRYDDTSPCTRCGSSMEDCDCCAEYELRSSMRSLGIQPDPRMFMPDDNLRYATGKSLWSYSRIDYDLAAVNRMLREFGY